MRVPCANCKDRHAECHAECDRYLKWSAERNEARERDYDKRIVDRYAIERDKKIKNKRLQDKARGRKR